MQVKDTKFMNLRRGDILLYRAGDLLWPDWDVLGNLIKTFEGNTGTSRNPDAPGWSKGDYTHCAWLRDTPDPDAEVEEVSDRKNVFRIKSDRTWTREEILPGKWMEEPELKVKRLCSYRPVRVHSTWPDVKEEMVDLENPHMEVWRMRRATSGIVEAVMKMANDMIGYKYDLADFVTFGNLHLPSAYKCADFISELAYIASLLCSDQYPICLTPDKAGNADQFVTPNDLVNSGELIKIDFQGVL